jgi:GMP synthase PP-ATPase subunit
MTGRAAIIGEDVTEETVRRLTSEIEQKFPQLEYILYDVTGKPPATVEWE